MATTFQRRPDGKDPRSVLDALKQTPDRKMDPRLDEARQKLERVDERTEISQDLASQLQASMGNDALRDLIKKGTETTTDSGENTAQEAQQQEEEDLEQEKEPEAGEVERVMPIFGHAGGSATGSSPWASHMFGGDDDGEAAANSRAGGRWRPMPSLPDPDEDIELEESEDDTDEPEDPLDFEAATLALGDATILPTLLNRGLRHPHRCAIKNFSSEHLPNLNRLDNAYGRASALIHFMADHADHNEARVLAIAAEKALICSERMGFSGTIAHSLALAELILGAMPVQPDWTPLLDVLLDPNSRAQIEEASAILAPQGQLSAPALLEQVLGSLAEAAEIDFQEESHPAAWEVVRRISHLSPLPVLELWQEPAQAPTEDEELSAMDALFEGLFERELPQEGITEEMLMPLFDGMNSLLGALGQAQVEVASAALPILRHGVAEEIVGICELFDSLLKRAARRLVRVGREVEGMIGSTDTAELTRLSAEAVAARASADLLRRAALQSLSQQLLPPTTAPIHLPKGWEEAKLWMDRAKTAEARQQLEAALEALEDSGQEAELAQLYLMTGAWMLEAGFGGAAELYLDWASTLSAKNNPALAAVAILLEMSLHLDRGWDEDAREAAMRLDSLGRDLNAPFVIAAAAIGASAASGQNNVLEDAAWWMQENGEGGALNLLKARWAEMAYAQKSEP